MCVFVIKKNYIPLKNWLEINDKDLEIDWNEDQKHQVAEILSILIKEIDKELLKDNITWKLCSTIFRRANNNTLSYTNMVHRDLDEYSVENLNKEGHKHFYNAWIPRSTILSNPLALLDKSTIEQENITGFCNLVSNRTAINFNENQFWFYFPLLQRGDVILWHSEAIFHASFITPTQQNATRNSVDMRIYGL